MPGFTFPEPATQATISDARRHLALQRDSVEDISQKIQEAEQNLARIVEESRCAIQELEREKVAAEESVAAALAYLSPIRRLPDEILRHIFLFNFEEYPCCAWVLAAVSSLWRRLVLSMPRLWSRVGGTDYSNFSTISTPLFMIQRMIDLIIQSQSYPED